MLVCVTDVERIQRHRVHLVRWIGGRSCPCRYSLEYRDISVRSIGQENLECSTGPNAYKITKHGYSQIEMGI